MLCSVPGICQNPSFILLVERKKGSRFFWFGLFIGFSYIYSFWNYVERMQLFDVCQRLVPVWLYTESAVQFRELTEASVLWKKFKSQTYACCLMVIHNAETKWSGLHCVTVKAYWANFPNIHWEPWARSHLNGQGRRERKRSWRNIEVLHDFPQGHSGSP